MGIKWTKIYFIVLMSVLPAGYSLGWITLSPISLNEIGDFLAGVFGPLSIFWLVLGFFQQGSELRLQVAELANSVEQQKELVSVSRETLDHERDLLKQREDERERLMAPRVSAYISNISSAGSPRLYRTRINMRNIGNQLSNVELYCSPSPVGGGNNAWDFWDNGQLVNPRLEFKEDFQESGLKLIVNCSDMDGARYSIYFELVKKVDGDIELVRTGCEKHADSSAPSFGSTFLQ